MAKPAAMRIAHRLHLPLLATNGVRYATAYDREILDVFTAIRHHTNLESGPPAHCQSTTPSARCARDVTRFSDFPQAIANTRALSERLEFELMIWAMGFPAIRFQRRNDG